MTPAPAGPVWQARTGGPAAGELVSFGDSTDEDAVLIGVDLAGSIAHASGLVAAGLLSRKQGEQLISGLQALWGQAQAGELTLDPALEDVHMNVEALLEAQIGDVAGTLHTGRSRNDQVALDTLLHTRLALVHLADGCHAVATALADQAGAHVETPWAAATHGQPAQPATLGFLLHAHALRFHALADQALARFETLDESPLGSGAVAGTTLPIDPAYTAALLGLEPPKNALLATGARDDALAVCQLVTRIGVVASSLAQDLYQLHNDGLVRLPAGYTTGSSMMPQKRNPDAVELARAAGTALIGPSTQAASLLAGLGLGYQRDLQVVKQVLLSALTDGQELVDLLAGIVPGLQADEDALAATLQTPGLGATDVAEGLVGSTGLPFRQVYTHVAQAQAAVEDGGDLHAALVDQGLPEEAVAEALAAAGQGAKARATAGGPAPAQVAQVTAELQEALASQAERILEAETLANQPLELLTAPPASLVPSTNGRGA